MRNKSAGVSKEVLASWVSAILEKALTKKNVKNGFRITGIFPFNPRTMDGKMGLSEFYRGGPNTLEEEVAAGAPMDLGSSENLQGISWKSFQECVQYFAEGSSTMHISLAEGQEVDSDIEESFLESEEQEEYLTSLEAALAEGEEQPVERPLRRHYFIPGSATEDDDG
jgi:hypothetical protein